MGKGQNYGSQKRQKEIKKQKKKQEKAEKKRARKEAVEGPSTTPGGETDDESEPPSWQLSRTERKPGASPGRAEQRPAARIGRAARRAEPRPAGELDEELKARLQALFDEGAELWQRFDTEVRQHAFHPFVPADYSVVLDALIPLRAPGLRFLEWGSANGVITIMADLLGFDAYGIEIDRDLVAQARELARRTGSRACFTAGSFVPTGYRWRGRDGDDRLGTIEHGDSGYLALGRSLDDFDLVFGYPWEGEAPVMSDLMKAHGRAGARLLMLTDTGVNIYRDGKQAA